jgi:Cu+-exporting ATPase
LSTTSLEECILLAASLSCQAGSVLKNAFYRILKGKTEMLYAVESYIYEDGLGLSGWIDNKRVLLGTRQLMVNHSIDGIPSEAKEQEYANGNTVIYLSVSGVISAMFVVRVSAALSVTKWLQKLESEGIVTYVRSVDGFLTKEFLTNLFELDEYIEILPFRFNKEYEKETEYTDKESSSMLCSGHFPSFAMLMIGAKRIRSASYFGIAIQAGAVVLGAVIALVSMIMGTFSQLTPSVVIAYNLVFAAISLLFLSNKKI